MNIKAFFENFKEKFTEIKDTVVSWIQENKKLAIIVVSLLSIILICIILLIGVSSKKKKPEPVYENKLELTHAPLVPNGPELPRDYTISRQTEESWSDAEAERWFSEPSETDMGGLSKANDNIIEKILGGTP